MKCFWSLLISAMIASNLCGQSVLDRLISVNFEGVGLEKALYELIDKSDVNLSFSNHILPKDKLLQIRLVNQPLSSVLKAMFEGTTLSFEMVGSQVVIIDKGPFKALKYYTISGYVHDAQSGERVIGAVVYDDLQEAGTYTNEFGFYSLNLKEGNHQIIASYLGYSADSNLVELYSNIGFDFELKPAYLQQVVVFASPDSVVLETKGLGSVMLHISHMQRMSSLGGEADVIRAAFNLPGIQTGADGFGGISVRGGNIDQNQYMLDGVTVYNATHGLGIFSIYNGSAIRSAQLIKGNFPAKYGGRISSVWDIQTKDGNFNQYQWELDMGLSSGKSSLEGPIAKGDGSFFISGRRAFFDLFSVPITRNLREKKGVDGFIDYYFYDLNLKLNHQLSKKDRFFFSFYQGLDDFKDIYQLQRTFRDTIVHLSDNDRVRWGNKVGAFRWTRQISDNLFGHAALSYSKYFYESQDLIDLETTQRGHRLSREMLLLKYISNIEDGTLKVDFDYNALSGHRQKFGFQVSRHLIQPGIIFFNQASAIDSILLDTVGQTNKAPLKSHEIDAYWQDEVILSKSLLLSIGLRVSAIAGAGGFYISPQPRFFLKFFPGKLRSYDVSISRMTQNLHLLSPTSIGMPKDLWVNSTKTVKPQQSWLFSAGVNQKILNDLELTIEGYYKTMTNLIIFKGTILEEVNSTNWQDKVSFGTGDSYGGELLLKKNADKIGGWLSYALTWSNRIFDKEINRGNPFPYRLDRRHSLSVQGIYKLNAKWTFASGLQIASGSAYTFPVQEYELVQAPGQPPSDIIPRPRVIDELNSERLPLYHRMDLSFDYHITRGKFTHSLRFGAYNVYNRKNPLYIAIRDKFTASGDIQKEAVQVSLLPFFPTLRYSIQFR